MWSFTQPAPERLRRLIASQEALGLTYPAVGVSAVGTLPGYDMDDNRILLGRGPAVFVAAREALRGWRQFPSPWTRIWPLPTPIAEGQTVAMIAHLFGLWWSNTCRIVAVFDEPTRFGFAYGTLPQHVERGEEQFLVEQHADGSVWYSIRAVSRPRYWMVRMAYPLARRMQRRFVRDSLAAMKAIAGTPHVAEGVR
jgi:uncharacterized protein (UPF0548 family)